MGAVSNFGHSARTRNAIDLIVDGKVDLGEVIEVTATQKNRYHFKLCIEVSSNFYEAGCQLRGVRRVQWSITGKVYFLNVFFNELALISNLNA